jgi:hypothetical protein
MTVSHPNVHSIRARIGLLNLIGGIMIAVGITGMVIFSIQAREALNNAALWQTEGFWFQMKEYVFMFTMIGGFIIVLYALVSLQRKRAKRLGNAP